MPQIWVKGVEKTMWCIQEHGNATNLDLKRYSNLPEDDVYIVCNGRRVSDEDLLEDGCVYHLVPRLLGGKGGFGSMLRAIGAQIEKTTNREACRDISGRRMRDVNNEKDLKEWVKKTADREREKEEKRKERRDKRRAEPNHKFDDSSYHEQKMTVLENLDQALQQGLLKVGKAGSGESAAGESSSQDSKKREGDKVDGSSRAKRACEWLGLDISLEDLSDSDTDSMSGADPGTPTPTSIIDPMGASTDGQANANSIIEPMETDSTEHSTDNNTVGKFCESSEKSIDNVRKCGPNKSAVKSSAKFSGKGSTSDKCSADSSSVESLDSNETSSVTEVKAETSVAKMKTEPGVTEVKTETSVVKVKTEPGVEVAGGTDIKTKLDVTEVKTEIVTETLSETDITEEKPELCVTELKTEPVTDVSEKDITKVTTVKTEPGATEVSEIETRERKPSGSLLSALPPPMNTDKPHRTESAAKQESGEMDLESYNSAEELSAVGLDRLKSALMAKGLKCGGTLDERAKRLFSIKGLTQEQISPALFAKPTRGRKKKPQS